MEPTTVERRKPNGSALPSWVLSLLPFLVAGLMAIGSAKVIVGGKEDASSHDADVAQVRADGTAADVALRNLIREAQNQRDLDFIRDSAWKADAMRILLDIQRKAGR